MGEAYTKHSNIYFYMQLDKDMKEFWVKAYAPHDRCYENFKVHEHSNVQKIKY